MTTPDPIYRWEYWARDEDSGEIDHWVEWNDSDEVVEDDFLTSNNVKYEFRIATDGERDAFYAGMDEGKLIATARNAHENWNGVAYTLDSFVPEIQTTKVFTCGVCRGHFKFSEAAHFGKYYITIGISDTENGGDRDREILWHLCNKCVMA